VAVQGICAWFIVLWLLCILKEIMSDWEDDATCSSFQMSSGAAFVPDYYAKKGEWSD